MRVYRKCITASVETVTSIVKATVCLHNFVMLAESHTNLKNCCPNSLIDKEDSDGKRSSTQFIFRYKRWNQYAFKKY